MEKEPPSSASARATGKPLSSMRVTITPGTRSESAVMAVPRTTCAVALQANNNDTASTAASARIDA